MSRKAIVYLERLQTQRGVLAMLGVAFGMGLFMTYALGPFGWLACVVALTPQVAGGTGIGTFSEELQKGQLRFLFALPLDRTDIWRMKLLSGIWGAFVAVLCLLSGVACGTFLRGGIDPVVPAVIGSLGFEVWHLAAMAGVATAYTYACGLLASLLTQRPVGAQFVNVLLAYGPGGLIWYVTARAGHLPSLGFVLSLLLGCGLSFLLAARALYIRRDPFSSERPAGLFRGWTQVGVTLVAVGLLSLTAGAWPGRSPGPNPDQVWRHAASPDGRWVAIEAIVGFGPRVVVLDEQGRVAADLGPGSGLPPGLSAGALAWTPDSEHLVVRREPSGLSLEDYEDGGAWLVWDVASGALRTCEEGREGLAGRTWFEGWSAEGRTLLGTARYWSGEHTSEDVLLASLDARAGTLGARPVGEEHVESPLSLVGGHLVWTDRHEEGTLLSFEAIESEEAWQLELAPDAQAWQLSHDVATVVVLRPADLGDSLGFELVALDARSGEEELLRGPDDLPSVPVQSAARSGVGRGSLARIGQTRWVLLTWAAAVEESSPLLIDTQARTVRALTTVEFPKELMGGAGLPVSPDGRSWFARERGSGGPEERHPIHVYRVTEGGFELRRLLEVPAYGDVSWWGNDRLLYRLPEHRPDGSSQSRLWQVRLEGGEPELFPIGGEARALDD